MQLQDNILEYESDAKCRTVIRCNQEMYLASEIDKWVFPGKICSIPTGVRIVGMPDNSAILITPCPWLHAKKWTIIPQVLVGNGYVFIGVLNTGILPIKISKEQLLASVTVVPRTECHVINAKE